MTPPRIPNSKYPTRHAPLQAGMVLSIDVPLLHEPWGGLRYEYGYLVTESGVEPLAPLPEWLDMLDSSRRKTL